MSVETHAQRYRSGSPTGAYVRTNAPPGLGRGPSGTGRRGGGLRRSAATGTLNRMVQYPQHRSHLRRPRGSHAPGRARAARPRERDDHGARRAVRHLAHRDEEARPGARGRRARHHREGRPGAPCTAGPRRLDDVRAWTDDYRRMLDERLDRFGELLERTKGDAGMTSDQQQAANATITTPTEREIHIEREFDAPRERVYAVYTDPKLIPEWWGPHGTTASSRRWTSGPAASWRFVIRNSDGSETAFRGTYREISPPERIVQTFEWEGMPGHVSVETATFEDLGDRTKVDDHLALPHDRGARRHARLRHGGRDERDLRPPRRGARAARLGPDRGAGSRATRAPSGRPGRRRGHHRRGDGRRVGHPEGDRARAATKPRGPRRSPALPPSSVPGVVSPRPPVALEIRELRRSYGRLDALPT